TPREPVPSLTSRRATVTPHVEGLGSAEAGHATCLSSVRGAAACGGLGVSVPATGDAEAGIPRPLMSRGKMRLEFADSAQCVFRGLECLLDRTRTVEGGEVVILLGADQVAVVVHHRRFSSGVGDGD